MIRVSGIMYCQLAEFLSVQLVSRDNSLCSDRVCKFCVHLVRNFDDVLCVLDYKFSAVLSGILS